MLFKNLFGGIAGVEIFHDVLVETLVHFFPRQQVESGLFNDIIKSRIDSFVHILIRSYKDVVQYIRHKRWDFFWH